MSELKPCPFCGGTPLLSEGPYDWDCGGRYYYSASIECTCGLTFEVDNPGPKEYTSDAEALNFIIDAWNTRAERTCKVAGVYVYGKRDELKAYALSCGHEFEWNDREPPAYCPECGSKVVDG